MIYEVYWDVAKVTDHSGYDWTKEPPRRTAVTNNRQLLAQMIKKSKDCTFIFIVTNAQHFGLKDFLKEYSLDDDLFYKMQRPITNPIHPSHGRNITLVVVGSRKHFWREWYAD